MISSEQLAFVAVAFATRGFILFGPTSKLERDFQLVGDNLHEAKAYASAKDCRGALLSFIPATWIAVLAEANTLCSGMVSAVWVLLATFLALILLWMFAKVPNALYRGNLIPYLVLLITLALDIITQAFLSKHFAALLCTKP